MGGYEIFRRGESDMRAAHFLCYFVVLEYIKVKL